MKFFCEYWKSGKEKEHYGVCKCGNQVFLLRLAYDTITTLSDRNPATGGGERYELRNYLFNFCRGRCDLPSRLQMVRQK